jgi:hypothetical protein
VCHVDLFPVRLNESSTGRQIAHTGCRPYPTVTATLPVDLPTLTAASAFDEDAWDDLLNYIEERRVVPILGPELLRVETATGPRLLYDWVAEKLAIRLSVAADLLPKDYNLNDVVCAYLGARGRREDAYTRIRSILREATFAPSTALRQLAQITDFDLFVTTTFDALLEQAINDERFGGVQSTEVIAYAPNRVTDLTTERAQLTRPVVYHLLGKLSASPTYVISDEDTIEFVCALQSEHLTPGKLFHELEHSHLLVIGGTFSNWLTRFFLRMTKRRRLSDPREVGEVLADDHSMRDELLVQFLHQVSARTRMFSGAEAFVAELHRRWMARRGPAKAEGAGALARFAPPEREMAEHAVFISYAREDLAAVQKLKAGLDAAGITAWFDMDRLASGDDFARKIQQNVGRCSFFIPVISGITQRRVEGWFRREWNWAVDRTHGMAHGAAFILPVCVDQTPEIGALVPDIFMKAHWTRLMGGDVTPEFAARLKELLSPKR